MDCCVTRYWTFEHAVINHEPPMAMIPSIILAITRSVTAELAKELSFDPHVEQAV